MKGSLPASGGRETSLSPESGNSGQEACINKPCIFFTNLLPQAQTQILH